MKRKIIIGIVLLLSIIGVGAYIAHAYITPLQEKVNELSSKTLDGKLQDIKNQARDLEQLKKLYDQKGGDNKLNELYQTSQAIQQLQKEGKLK